jgi:hypothetical protein
VSGDRGGSHNIVMGRGNKFTSSASAGIVGGLGNSISGYNNVILTGYNNQIDAGRY